LVQTWYSDLLWDGQSGDRIQVVAKFSTNPDQPWGSPSLLYQCYWVFPR